MLLGQPQWQPLVNTQKPTPWSSEWQSLANHYVTHGVATITYENIYLKALDIIFHYIAGSQRYLDMV